MCVSIGCHHLTSAQARAFVDSLPFIAQSMLAEVFKKRSEVEHQKAYLDKLHNTYQDCLGLQLITQDGEHNLQLGKHASTFTGCKGCSANLFAVSNMNTSQPSGCCSCMHTAAWFTAVACHANTPSPLPCSSHNSPHCSCCCHCSATR